MRHFAVSSAHETSAHMHKSYLITCTREHLKTGNGQTACIILCAESVSAASVASRYYYGTPTLILIDAAQVRELSAGLVYNNNRLFVLAETLYQNHISMRNCFISFQACK